MNEQTYNTIKAVLAWDVTMTSEDRHAVLEYCKNPIQAVAIEPKQVDQFLTREIIVDRLNVCERTVDRWIKSGELRSVLIGGVRRVSSSVLAEFLGKHSSGGQGGLDSTSGLDIGPKKDFKRAS